MAFSTPGWKPPSLWTIHCEVADLVFTYDVVSEIYRVSSMDSLIHFLDSGHIPSLTLAIAGVGELTYVADDCDISSKVFIIGEHCIKLTMFDDVTSCATSADLPTQTSALQRAGSPALAEHIVPHRHAYPGLVTVMKNQSLTVSDVSHEMTDDQLLQFYRWSCNVLLLLAKHGLEARNFKTSAIGVTNHSFVLLDPSQILRIDNCHQAVCTYPACAAYMFGSDTLIGLAATAWAFLANVLVTLGHTGDDLWHGTVNLLPQVPPGYNYSGPVALFSCRFFLQTNQSGKSKAIAFATRAIETYATHFSQADAPDTFNRAVVDAIKFYNQVAVDLAIANGIC